METLRPHAAATLLTDVLSYGVVTAQTRSSRVLPRARDGRGDDPRGSGGRAGADGGSAGRGDRTRISATARASFLTPSSGLEALQGVVLSRAEKLRLFPRGGPS